MSITVQHIEENLCWAHIYAVAGMAGISLGVRHVHDYGVDGQFEPVILRAGKRHIVQGIPLSFQAKSTINWTIADGHIVYDLETKTYNDFVSRTEAESTLILILLCLPKDRDHWHSVSSDITTLRTCCYYHRVRGLPVDNEKSTKRIRIPLGQVFTPSSLTDLLAAERARREGQVS